MPVKYTETYELFFPHDPEEDICEPDETGFNWPPENPATADFSGLLDLLYGTEPNCSDLEQATWYSAYDTNEGTREWYEEGIRRNRAYHPVNDRDRRWFRKAWLIANA